MAERIIDDGMVIVQAMATGDLTASVDAIGAYVDLSKAAVAFTISESQTNVTVLPHGENRRARVLSGQQSGTLSMTFLRNPAGTPDPEMTFETIKAGGGRFNFAIQEDRAALIAQGDTDPTPDASPANPQYAGSAVLTSLDPFGTADGTSAASLTVTADLDRDYARYTS